MGCVGEHQNIALTVMTVAGDGNNWYNGSVSKGLIAGRDFIGPLLLMVVTPAFANLVTVVLHHFDGDFTKVFASYKLHGTSEFISYFPSAFDPAAWKVVLLFFAAAILLTAILPGPKYLGPYTPGGNRPVYHDNGVLYYFTFIACFLAGTQYGFGFYNAGILYDLAPQIQATLNVVGLVVCAILYIKGHVAPSTSDTHISGSIVQDFYVGIELHARILGFDVKQITNCRFGMIWWPVANISYTLSQLERYGTVDPTLVAATIVHLVYMFKFFLWEKGYFNSMDMQHDRSGYYLCWGCIVWVPALYNLPAHYAAGHLTHLPVWVAGVILFVGLGCVYINYDCDAQRATFRESDGHALVWGERPKFILATYRDEKGNERSSKLLLSGYWGVSRHLHYIFEWGAALSWTPPVHAAVLPYCYFVFLLILLTDRASRDEHRCRGKYGKSYDDYCTKVPYKIMPYVY